MKAHLFNYTPANWSWERYEGLLTRWRRGERVVENWSVHNFYKQIVVGSQAWLLGQGSAPHVICGFNDWQHGVGVGTVQRISRALALNAV